MGCARWPGDWHEKALVELNMVIKEKKALVPVSHNEYRALKLKYGDCLEHITVMTICSVKTLAERRHAR